MNNDGKHFFYRNLNDISKTTPAHLPYICARSVTFKMLTACFLVENQSLNVIGFCSAMTNGGKLFFLMISE
jgi:hypothetical protein